MRIITAYLIGLVFGVGIAISGMANPAKVLNFFDIAGSWDPSLVFVMGGAVITTFIGYNSFQLPTNNKIDLKLLGGSAIFGIGWGIAGFCPGGALPALGTGRWEVFAFTLALLGGIFLAKFLQSLAARKAQSAA